MNFFFQDWSLARFLRNRIAGSAYRGEAQPRPEMRVFETKRLVLRKFQQDDLKDLVRWQKDSGAAYTESEAQGFLDFCFREYVRCGIGPWGIRLRETGTVIGSCSFCYIHPNRKCGEVNYYVAPQYRGQGIAPEALGAVLEFGFADVGLARIEARCPPGNTSSERVMQKAGMNFERMISSSEEPKGRSKSSKLYTILQRHFKPRPSE